MMKNITGFKSLALPNLYSAQIAAFASFSTTAGRANSLIKASANETLFQLAMFPAAITVLRSDETIPAVLTPIPEISWDFCNSLTTSIITFIKSWPPDFGVSFRKLPKIFPLVSTTPPKTLVPPISMPTVRPECALAKFN